MKDTKSIITVVYQEVQTKMKSNLSKYKKYISKFMSERSTQFYSNAPSEQIYFNQTDVDEFFSSTGISIDTVRRGIELTYYNSISNFNPRYAKDECTIAMLCIIKHFLDNKMKKELELAIINMAFSGKYYPSIWYGSFPTAAPQAHIMEYVVTNMASNKYDIVREGNVIGAIRSISMTWIDTYKDKFSRFHDEDCVYLIQQLHNRIRSFMNNIAELYYDAYKNKDKLYITYDSDDISEDNYHLSDSDSLRLERIVTNTMKNLSTHGVDYKSCKISSNQDVKMDELKSIVENILNDNNNIPMVKEYITITVATYFRQTKNRDVRNIDFITYAIKPKPNVKDEHLIRQRELLNLILMNNAEHFARRRNRAATEASYYRAINSYFALIIQKSN